MVSPRILRSPSNRPSAVTIRPLRTISSVGCWACEFVKSTDAQQAPKKSIHCRPSFLRAVLPRWTSENQPLTDTAKPAITAWRSRQRVDGSLVRPFSVFCILRLVNRKLAVGMWESRVLCEISKSLWKPFCGFHRDVISIAIFDGAPDRADRGEANDRG